MIFLNSILLLGALGVLIPIIIHVLNRQSNRSVEWGAMQFLLESLAIRNRRIQLEETLLMATRCLLVGLLALALARPFIPPGSTVPWTIVLPLLLAAITGIGIAFALQRAPKRRLLIGGLSLLCLGFAALLILFEEKLNLSRFNPTARQDIALIIDASNSMTLLSDGRTNFSRAVDEAIDLVKRAPQGHAFSLILGGPSPSAKITTPTTDRFELETRLKELKPLNGPMASYQALTLATLSLTQGDQPAKQIILFTDNQNVGWDIGKAARWNFLRDAFDNLPSKPQIMIRRMVMPDALRNLAVSDIRLSRKIVGIDRPVKITVTIENTGNESVTPSEVLLKINNEISYSNQSLGQVLPGEKISVTFEHQFTSPGAYALTASLEVADDLPTDNTSSTAIQVTQGLQVLLVEGHPSRDFLDRAATLPALALNPIRHSDKSQRSVVTPTIVSFSKIGDVDDLSIYDVIILADVIKLPTRSAKAIAQFVNEGGGLLVAAGIRADASYYNQWMVDPDSPLLPAQLTEQATIDSTGNGFSPATQSLAHPAFIKIADPATSDIDQTIFNNYRPQTIPESLQKETSIGARLTNGDILLTSTSVGRGRVAMWGTAMDTRSGNWATRQAFVPFIHEIVYDLANANSSSLNVEPGWEVNVVLATPPKGHYVAGLEGRYFSSHQARQPAMIRQDQAIQYEWGASPPSATMDSDNLKVQWLGEIQAPYSGNYLFSAEVDDRVDIRIDSGTLIKFHNYDTQRKASVKMTEGRWYPFEATYFNTSGEARATLFWESRRLNREVIPSTAFRSLRKFHDQPRAKAAAIEYTVEGPDATVHTALVSATDRGLLMNLIGDISSGLHHLRIPQNQRHFFTSYLPQDSNRVPFTVKRDPSESYLTELSEADHRFISQFVTLSKPNTLDEMIGFLKGNQFGQELWEWLALGAVLFLLVEITLSRWIAKSRRMGEEIDISFDRNIGPSQSFREQLAKIRKH